MNHRPYKWRYKIEPWGRIPIPDDISRAVRTGNGVINTLEDCGYCDEIIFVSVLRLEDGTLSVCGRDTVNGRISMEAVDILEKMVEHLKTGSTEPFIYGEPHDPE